MPQRSQCNILSLDSIDCEEVEGQDSAGQLFTGCFILNEFILSTNLNCHYSNIAQAALSPSFTTTS